MEAYVSWTDDHRPNNYDFAQVVEAVHAELPWHERMIVIAGCHQKNAMSATWTRAARGMRRWVGSPTLPAWR
ncbi:hypothetical protein LN047_09075 [Achromobacter sp. JD417]|uniref:hypothetical protein n=1 Tax=Achromobacter sp. JD417 TaxID=2893881 RepID=UPI0035A5D4DF